MPERVYNPFRNVWMAFGWLKMLRMGLQTPSRLGYFKNTQRTTRP
jgi:hypothetical protein